ncbi:hypothetical protein K435DRAFT_690824 [Dendrothele bispora CBS 962.96]|uniref:Uncharacterized protein n=1 Tax=Dendrothele bispora (strain CBS 962.96) TaxID=1314807 RepID=A0A4S8L2Z5_DENBC|nr:hypothetical protein K435DRAFT_690824 [Dendrothele bispora CBS 962.96]
MYGLSSLHVPLLSIFRLSALLAEATSNQTYLNAASNAADFIHNHLTDSNNTIRDGLGFGPDNSCNQSSLVLLYNSVMTIHGLAILVSLTKNTTQEQW